MLFNYKIINQNGEEEQGSIDAINIDIAINSLQRRGFIVVTINPEGGMFWEKNLAFFERVSTKEIVILSRQISILFESHVSTLRIFRLLADGTESKVLQKRLNEVADDIQGGMSLSAALAKHPGIFTEFYVNMVKAGEESGKLSETFNYMADYLERQYELITKTRNALMYPAFVVTAFISVMTLMLVVVIPKLTAVLIESGQPIPLYTQIVIGLSDFVRDFGIILVVILAVGGTFLVRFGIPGVSFSQFKLAVPLFGRLFQKTYLSRISDNLNTMLSAGVPMLHSIEITAKVVGDQSYQSMLYDVAEKVKGGNSLSEALSGREQVPNIVVQMVKVGEESGELSLILRTLARFYKREADSMVDTLVGLIEPIMIVLLAVGVGSLLASVLIPIYNITANIS